MMIACQSIRELYLAGEYANSEWNGTYRKKSSQNWLTCTAIMLAESNAARET
jgi:hypothetical protein